MMKHAFRVLCLSFLMLSVVFGAEVRIPIAAEAQTSMSSKENFHHKTLIRMSFQGKKAEIPVFRYDLGAFKGSKLAKVEMTMNVEKNRAQDYTLTLKAIGGEKLIPWDAKKATLKSARSTPSWGVGGFLKMKHGPDLATAKLPKGGDRALLTFSFTEDGVAHIQAILDGKKPNNGMFLDLPRLKVFPRIAFDSVNQRETLQPYLILTVLEEEKKTAAKPKLSWPGDEGAIKCEITSDNSICAHADEELDNHGVKDKIRIKYIQHFWAGKFDLTGANGKEIVAAKLRLKKAGSTIDMKKFWASTITSDFTEGKCDDYGQQPQQKKGGACYRFAGDEKQFWGRPRDAADYAVKKVTSPPKKPGQEPRVEILPVRNNMFFDPDRPGPDDFTDVLFGNGASRYHFATNVPKTDDEWYEVVLPGELIQSILIDESKGLCLYDGSGTDVNYEVYSRESQHKPVLLLKVKDYEGGEAAAPADFTVKPVGPHCAEMAVLEWKEGENTFGYDIKVDGKIRPRFQSVIGKGKGQAFKHYLDFLPTGKHEIEVVPFNKVGKRGRAAKASVSMPEAAAAVKLTDPANEPKQKAEKYASADNPIHFWACDEMEMVDPHTGKLFHSGDEKYKLGNSVWDGKNVTLVSARDAVTTFQVILEPDAKKGPKTVPDIEFRLTDFVSADSKKLKVRKLVKYFSVWYHQAPGMKHADGKARYLGDALIPIDDPDSLPVMPNGKVPGQKNQAFFVEIYVPDYALPGDYEARLAVSTAVSDDVVPVRLKIYDVAVPKTFTYRHELNLYSSGVSRGTGVDGYENPDCARQVGVRLRQMARFNRLIVNNLPYSQSGRTIPMMIPIVKGIGKNIEVADWSPIDKTLEPLATGEAFTAAQGYFGPLSGVPEPHIYLPIHEAWPMDMSKFYRNHPGAAPELAKFDMKSKDGKRAAKKAFKREIFPKFRQQCGSPEEDLGGFYQDAQVKIATLFARHFAEKGWSKTKWQIYLNNKPGFGRPSVFTLDEPISELDFRALGWFNDLWKKGFDAAGAGDKVTFEYRADISRPQWQFSFLDGHAVNLHCISSAFYRKNYKVRNRARQFDWETWVYGGGPSVRSTTMTMYGVFLNTYSLGADGILPYYTGMKNDFEKFGSLAILYQATKEQANKLGMKTKVTTVTGKNRKGEMETHSYVGPFSSARLVAGRSAVQDIELLNELARRLKVHRDVMRQSLRKSLDFSMKIHSTNPDDPGTTVFTTLTPSQIFAFRKTLLEKLEGLKDKAAN